MTAPANGAAPERIIFVHYGEFNCNSAIQAHHFAGCLSEAGAEVILFANGDPGTLDQLGRTGGFLCLDLTVLGEWLSGAERATGTVIYSWTPREVVRDATERLVTGLGAPYVVHLEDNESYVTRRMLGIPDDSPGATEEALSNEFFRSRHSHPEYAPAFLGGAAGATVITPALKEHIPPHVPTAVVRPGVDTARFAPGPPSPDLMAELGLDPSELIIVYPGNLHRANNEEMASLYLGVALARRRGVPARLVRLGVGYPWQFDPLQCDLSRDAIELGPQPWKEVPRFLALADLFVQPGRLDEFNRYRLPSKLPEFMAMGRPVVLPACNLGAELRDREQALLLRTGSAIEIADRIGELAEDQPLREALGRAARRFAEDELSWEAGAERLAAFLGTAIAAADGHQPTEVTA